MKSTLLFLLLIISARSVSGIELQVVRDMYAKAVEDKEVARTLLQQLKQAPKNPVINGYLGAVTVIQAKHAINPFVKLSYFNSGKKILENAISSSPQNVELRFLRYGIQLNAPAFLNYRSNREADRDFLVKSLREGRVIDRQLKSMLESFLKQERGK